MELLDRIQDFINDKIIPSLSLHGGSIDVISLDDGVLRLEFVGSCESCGIQNLTSESIINYLLENFDELKDVIIENPLD